MYVLCPVKFGQELHTMVWLAADRHDGSWCTVQYLLGICTDKFEILNGITCHWVRSFVTLSA